MLYVSFAYSADSAMLGLLHDHLRTLDPQATLYIISDPKSPVDPAAVPGAKHRLGTVDRGGNLNGLPIIAEELTTYQNILDLESSEHIVKIDADCYPLNLAPLLNTDDPAGIIISERWQPFTPAGMIYRLSRPMVAALLDHFNARTEANLWQENAPWPEDITIWNLAIQTGLPVKMLPYRDNYAAGVPDTLPAEYPPHLLQAHFLHCGEPLPDGTRISRPHATLRMRILAEHIALKQS